MPLNNIYDALLYPRDEEGASKVDYPTRGELLDEVANRSLFAISPLSVLTHMPLVQKSIEDTLFEQLAQDLDAWFSKRIDQVDGQNASSVVAQLNKAEGWLIQPDHSLLGNDRGRLLLARLLAPDQAQRRQRLWPGCIPSPSLMEGARIVDRTLKNLVKEKPAVFLTGAYSRVGAMLHSKALEEYTAVADKPNAIHSELPSAEDIRKLTLVAIALFRQEHRLLRWYVNRRVRLTLEKLDIAHDPQLGGAVTQFTSAKHEHEDDVRDVIYEWDATKREIRVRWHRSHQYWAYTFIESFMEKERTSFDLATISQLAKAPLDVIECYLGEAMEYYLASLFSMSLPGNVLASRRLRESVKGKDLARPFPGSLIVGAHYAFVPLGVMVAMLFFPRYCARVAAKCAEEVRVTDTFEAKNWREWKNGLGKRNVEPQLKNLSDLKYAEFLRLLKDHGSHPDPQIAAAVAVVIERLSGRRLAIDKDEDVDAQLWCDLLRLGGFVSELVHRESSEASAMGTVLAGMCVDFWQLIETGWATKTPPPVDARRTKSTLSSENSGAKAIRPSGYSDFVACFVIDKSAIYFSNFMPLGNEQFTRTFFVDLSLGSYQRGRLALRLCDIASYRSMCVKDIDRARAIVRGIDEDARNLSELQGTLATLGKSDFENQQRVLTEIDHLQEEMAQYDLYLTYGVKGRALSTSAYLDRIKERVEDIRADRIAGYPMLGDFLSRRVASIVRDFERTATRYDEMRGRIQDLYGRIRTRLNSVEVANIQANLKSMLVVQNAAELLVYFGGTYYLYSLLHKVFGEKESDWRSEGSAIIATLVLVTVLRWIYPLAKARTPEVINRVRSLRFWKVFWTNRRRP